MLPELPRLVHRALENNPSAQLAAIERAINRVERTQRLQTAVLATVIVVLMAVAGTYAYLLLVY